jgi:hypothetical protein
MCCTAMSRCNVIPTFYYLLRDPTGDVRGVIRSYEHYGRNAMLGAYQIEETNQSQVETLEAFGLIDTFDIV